MYTDHTFLRTLFLDSRKVVRFDKYTNGMAAAVDDLERSLKMMSPDVPELDFSAVKTGNADVLQIFNDAGGPHVSARRSFGLFCQATVLFLL